MSGPLETGWEPLKEIADELYSIQEVDTRRRYEGIAKSIDKINKKISAQEAHIAKMRSSDRQLRKSTLDAAKVTLSELYNELMNITNKMNELRSFARAHNFKLTNLENQIMHIERRVSNSDIELSDLMDKLILGGKRNSNKKQKKRSKKHSHKLSKKKRNSSKKKVVTRK
jgi:chromosome segregation ATPase